MTALFAGLTTLDVLHRLDHAPDPTLKVTSSDFTMAAGGPATNAAVTYAALCAATSPASSPNRKATTPHRTPQAPARATLLTALGEGPVSAFLAQELSEVGVTILDATTPTRARPEGMSGSGQGAPASSPGGREPAVSSIIEYPDGRMVASTNARVDADPRSVKGRLPERVGVVLIDGHNPALAHAALTLGVALTDGEDPFAQIEARPTHPRILDGGSWKEWLPSLLGFVDIAVVSQDFAPPLIQRPQGEQVAQFLRGFGITRTIRTRGEHSVQYWWDDRCGEVPVQAVEGASTLGAGDAFHGAFAWAIERAGDADPEDLIRFASSVASLSVSSFGTRQWLASPRLAALAGNWRQAHP